MKKKNRLSLATAMFAVLLLGGANNACAQTFVEIGDGTDGNLFFPMMAHLANSVSQQIYLASDIGSTPMDINAIAFHHIPYDNTAADELRIIRVYLTATNERYITQQGGWLPVSDADMVCQDGFYLTTDDRWLKIDFTGNFHYDGHSNILVTVIDITGEAASGGMHAFCYTLHDDNDTRTMCGTNTNRNTYGPSSLGEISGIAASGSPNIRFYKTAEPAEVQSTSTWYAFTDVSWGEHYNPFSLVSFTMQNVENPQNIINLPQPEILTGHPEILTGEYAGGNVYFVGYYPNTLYRASFTESDHSMSDVEEIAEFENGVEAMSFNPVDHTMYGIDGDLNTLEKINLSNAVETTIGETRLDGVVKTINSFAINAQGEAFAIASDNNLYRVNLSNGSLTLVGHTGLDAGIYSPMAFDRSTGELFWYQLGFNAWGLYKVNTGTGAAQLVSQLDNNYVELRALFRIDPTCVGIESAEDIEASVYPNPTSGVVNVAAEGLQRVDVMDITGRTVATLKHSGNQTLSAEPTAHHKQSSIDLSTQPAGLYMLRIITASGTTMREIMKR